jgi:hypothetical protein
MAGMDLATILTAVTAFVGAFVGTCISYFIRHRRAPVKHHLPSSALWGAPMPVVESSRIPDGAITSEKISFGPITPNDLAAGDPRDDR